MSELLSVVVPAYNEFSVLGEFHRRLSDVMSATGMGYEIIYVDDGSTDDTVTLLNRLREEDPALAIIELSRNFGKEVALSAGLDHANGDAVIIIDADLQDPPELIDEFLREWRNGYDIVYGSRTDREGESWLKITTAKWFYRVINRLSDVEIPRDAGDFRLISRRALDALVSMRETHRYMKGLYAWVGFPQKEVPYLRQPRAAGETKWNYWRLWNFALEGITSFSDVPLKMSTYLGVLTSTAAFLYGLYFLVRTLFLGNPVPGYPSLMLVVLFLGGVQLICLGIIGEYLARTYNESKSRALYFVKGYHPARSRAAAEAESRINL
ncbi:MAG: glycosyltransferase family 2 protein [Proteobacteria bacterium]|nr:glycosyltransferase family 2 protein [Pseudomonadota bacterium]